MGYKDVLAKAPVDACDPNPMVQAGILVRWWCTKAIARAVLTTWTFQHIYIWKEKKNILKNNLFPKIHGRFAKHSDGEGEN